MTALGALQRHAGLRAQTEGRALSRALRRVYFDSPELGLLRAGLHLELTRSGRGWLQRLWRETSDGEPLALLHEVRVAEERVSLALLADAGLRDEIERLRLERPLEAVAVLEARHTRRRIHQADALVQFSLEAGELTSARGREAYAHLTLTSEQGDPGAPHELALALREAVALRPIAVDPAARLRSHLTGEQPEARRVRRRPLPRHASLEDVLAAGAEACLEQILANHAVAHAGDDPEGVHQMRVGVRRLRSLLTSFRPMLPPEQVQTLREELRWLAAELGIARDLDVFLEETLEPLQARFADDGALKRLRDETRELRAQAYAHLRRELDSPRTARLQLRLGQWLARRAWRDQPLSLEAARLFAPAREQADALLARRWRKVRRACRRLDSLSIDEKHRLRVDVKKLRYGAESLAAVYPSGRAERFLRRLGDLQDVLGHLNDVATAERLLGQVLEWVGPEARAEHVHAAGFVAGWTARGAEDIVRRLGKRAKDLRRLEPFWKRD